MKHFSKMDVVCSMRKALALLKENNSPRYTDLITKTFSCLAEEEPELKPESSRNWDSVYNRNDIRAALAVPISEAYWYLIYSGYIVPGAGSHYMPDLTEFRITAIGREWAEEHEPPPEDMHGFLMALRGQVRQLDSVVAQYVQEAVMAYARGMSFASAVMIGAASEKTIYLLMDALENSVKDPGHKKTIRESIEKRKLPSMFKCLHENLIRAKKSMPWHVHEGTDTHLLSLQEAIRVQRNDAVHPQVGKVTPQTVRLALASFPGACKKAFDLIEWLQNNHF